jgi:hypothetical protein
MKISCRLNPTRCYILLIFCLLSSCVLATQPALSPQPDNELLQFAKANCFFQYFQKKGYDLKDIRAISGGIVERGSASPEQYEQVTELVKNYKPQLTTKQKIDIELLKCFTLDQDDDFLHALAVADEKN